MEQWKLRLGAIQETVLRRIEEVKEATGEDRETVRRELKSINSLFIEETRTCLDKLSENDIIEYTKTQIEAQILTSFQPSTSMTQAPHHIQSKLPKLELPKFNGDVLKWSEFWDRFSSSIDNQNLSNVDKLSYLQSSLGLEALAAIEGLKTTNENYPVAVDILKGRYGKPGLVIDAHYEALFKIKKANNTPKDCMDVFNEIERHLRTLMAMGEDVKHNNLRTIILSKFPDEIIYELKTKMNPEEENVENIRKFLETHLTARMSSWKRFTTEALHIREINVRTKVTPKHRLSNANPKFSRNFTPSTSSQQSRPSKRKLSNPHAPIDNKKRKILPCIFCTENHYNNDCHLSLKERIKNLRKRCFKCFKEGHQAKMCQAKIRCYHCKDQHNSALCTKRNTHTENKTKGDDQTIQCLGTGGDTILETAIVSIKNGNSMRKCRAVLDTGSKRSYVSTTIAEELSLNVIEPNFLTVYTFGTTQPLNIESPVTEIRVIGTESMINMRVNIIPYITENIECPSNELQHHLPKDRKIHLADNGSLGRGIDMLIGNDYYQTVIKPERIQCGQRLYLLKSEFGWIWSGGEEYHEEECMSFVTYEQNQPLQVFDSTTDRPLRQNLVHKLWDLETIGIIDCPKSTRDDEAVEDFNRTVKFKNGRYWIKWPWYKLAENLPDNFGLAYGRLLGLLKRMDTDTLKKYDAVLKDQIQNGIIEKINDNDRNETANHVHYLPHHGVKKDNKIRIVYDASSKVKGSSLNECLYRGPLLLENLVGLLLRFRTHKYGVLADVEKAFLQIGIQESDRDVTRFLWLKDVTKQISQENLLHLRFCRVPFGIGCSPFLLAITLKHHLKTVNTPTCKKVAHDIYVDNLVTGGDCAEECLQLYGEVKSAFDAISMNMRDWCTNNVELKEVTERGTHIQKDIMPVLGMNWLVKEDTLSPKFNLKANTKSTTKRQILSHISAIYDPCGYAAPLLVGSKLFFQNLWKKKLEWDTILPESLQIEWDAIASQLEEVKYVKIPRWYGLNLPLKNERSSLELHCYCDASNSAYAAAVYLKVTENNKSVVNLVLAKSRLKPVKNEATNTIPRLELLGVLVGCRLISYVQNYIDIVVKSRCIWTDSQIVLHWLNTKKILPPFVKRRIAEIKKSIDVEFRYVRTEQNPADIATRPYNRKLANSSWFQGPHYLKKNASEWPKTQISYTMLTRAETEELEVIKKLQEEYFPGEMNGKVTNLTRTLGLFKDEGILRCRGRFKMTDWPVDQKYPILLPKNDDFTIKKIEGIHKKLYHVGVSQTLANVRLKYWIPHGRSQVQKILKKCQACKKHGGGPYKVPPIAQLPEERVKFSPPFSYTGTDYLGPLYVATKGGSFEKRWICLFTCLAVRAVHLEIVTDLTATECLMALRRFMATRGVPSKIISDNATNYKLTAEILSSDFCIKNDIKWKFIPELAPWFGGVYERLVALVKHCLKRTIDKHTLNDSQLLTVTKEVEAVLNCRPLTTVGAEIEHVLTPADFLRVGGAFALEESEVEFTELSTDTKRNLIEGWKRGQAILEEFKRMFTNQYLPTLRERFSLVRQPRVISCISHQIGDVVQIKDDGPRIKWKVGEICELLEGRDEEIRVAKVKIGNKEYTRAIGHLYPLEVQEQKLEGNQSKNIQTQENEGVESEKEALPSIENWAQRDRLVMDGLSHGESHENIQTIVTAEEEDNNEREVESNQEKENSANTESVSDRRIKNTKERRMDDIEVIEEEKDNSRIKDGKETRRAAQEAKRKILEWTEILSEIIKDD